MRTEKGPITGRVTVLSENGYERGHGTVSGAFYVRRNTYNMLHEMIINSELNRDHQEVTPLCRLFYYGFNSEVGIVDLLWVAMKAGA